MRIVSKIKDYYDHVGHRYGEDPDCFYLRGPFKIIPDISKFKHRNTALRDTLDHYIGGGRKRQYVSDLGYSMDFVIAGARSYPFIHYASGKMEMLGEQHERLLQREYTGIRWRKGQDGKPNYPETLEGERLNDLIRLVGAPVFLVRGSSSVYPRSRLAPCVDEQIPVLADLGFPALVSAGQMWQEIYSTLTNVLRTNPDRAPPVEVAEKYRIQEKGFDLKTSFRHPVNLKKLK